MFEKLRYSNGRSTKFETLYQEQKHSAEENGKMIFLQISPKMESLYGLGRQATTVKWVCIEFRNFCKVNIWAIFRRKLLNLAG